MSMKLYAYAGARGFNPELRQYASRVPGHRFIKLRKLSLAYVPD